MFSSRVAALDVSHAFNRVWYAGIFHKLNSYGISGSLVLFLLFSVIEGFE